MKSDYQNILADSWNVGPMEMRSFLICTKIPGQSRSKYGPEKWNGKAGKGARNRYLCVYVCVSLRGRCKHVEIGCRGFVDPQTVITHNPIHAV